VTEKHPNFDFEGFYKALDATRESRNLTWKQVSVESFVGPSTLARMAQNRRPDADGLAALAAWSGLNPADFVTNQAKALVTEPLANISMALRNDPRLGTKDAEAIEKIVRTAYTSLLQTGKRTKKRNTSTRSP